MKSTIQNNSTSTQITLHDLISLELFREFLLAEDVAKYVVLSRNSYSHTPYITGCFKQGDTYRVYCTDERGMPYDISDYVSLDDALKEIAHKHNLVYIPPVLFNELKIIRNAIIHWALQAQRVTEKADLEFANRNINKLFNREQEIRLASISNRKPIRIWKNSVRGKSKKSIQSRESGNSPQVAFQVSQPSQYTSRFKPRVLLIKKNAKGEREAIVQIIDTLTNQIVAQTYRSTSKSALKHNPNINKQEVNSALIQGVDQSITIESEK